MQGNSRSTTNGLLKLGVARWIACGALAPVTGLLIFAANSSASRAETLQEALVSAYRTNPGLDAQRASLRASDEAVPQAKAGFRPTITGTATTGFADSATRPRSSTDGESHPKTLGVTLSQPLFRGFRSYNTLNVAEASVRAAREALRVTEQQTMLDSATAYLDVVRDQLILQARENNVRVLTEQLRSTREQFAVGEVTKTDVAQAEANRAAAVAQFDLAKATLRNSRATYERVIGHPPSYLIEQREPSNLLPRTVTEAIEIGLAENPNIINAVYVEQQARHNIDLIRGELLPAASLNAQYSHSYESASSKFIEQQDSTSVTGQVTWQLYNGGDVEARTRAAKQTAVQRLQQIEQNKNQVQAQVVQAWSSLMANRAAVVSDDEAVRANRTALTGVREEYKVGQRTLLDVLNAEQTLLNSQVSLITDQRNLVVQAYTLLQTVGRLDPLNLGYDTKIYDEEAHYQEVKTKWTGFSIEYADGRLEEVRPGDDIIKYTDIGPGTNGLKSKTLDSLRATSSGGGDQPQPPPRLPPSILEKSAPAPTAPVPAPFKPTPANPALRNPPAGGTAPVPPGKSGAAPGATGATADAKAQLPWATVSRPEVDGWQPKVKAEAR